MVFLSLFFTDLSRFRFAVVGIMYCCNSDSPSFLTLRACSLVSLWKQMVGCQLVSLPKVRGKKSGVKSVGRCRP